MPCPKPHSNEGAGLGFISRWSDFKPVLSSRRLYVLGEGTGGAWGTMDKSQPSGVKLSTCKTQKKLFSFEQIFS